MLAIVRSLGCGRRRRRPYPDQVLEFASLVIGAGIGDDLVYSYSFEGMMNGRSWSSCASSLTAPCRKGVWGRYDSKYGGRASDSVYTVGPPRTVLARRGSLARDRGHRPPRFGASARPRRHPRGAPWRSSGQGTSSTLSPSRPGRYSVRSDRCTGVDIVPQLLHNGIKQ